MSRKVMPVRDRLDRLLVARGLAESREQAGRLILAGAVKVQGIRADKSSMLVSVEATIEVAPRALPYVSRAGGKLAAALDTFGVDPAGLITMDVGASTGGFTDCLLQRGAQRVYAVDVGYGQLDWRLRQDPRVVILDRRNIRYLDRSEIADSVAMAVIDVSFISLRTVLPSVMKFLDTSAVVIGLVKPQFEVGRDRVGRGGIVRDEALRTEAIDQVRAVAETLGLEAIGKVDSPIVGQKGNREILVGWRAAGMHE
ncbi:MAG: TlyA family RNA methyltransferase [Nitrospirae bacterium]|nr:TlyA family RNA methyltransferase [Nitrospirota bacterium]